MSIEQDYNMTFNNRQQRSILNASLKIKSQRENSLDFRIKNSSPIMKFRPDDSQLSQSVSKNSNQRSVQISPGRQKYLQLAEYNHTSIDVCQTHKRQNSSSILQIQNYLPASTSNQAIRLESIQSSHDYDNDQHKLLLQNSSLLQQIKLAKFAKREFNMMSTYLKERLDREKIIRRNHADMFADHTIQAQTLRRERMALSIERMKEKAEMIRQKNEEQRKKQELIELYLEKHGVLITQKELDNHFKFMDEKHLEYVLEKRLQNKIEKEAALVIQKNVKALKQRRKYYAIQQKRLKAALYIQDFWKRYQKIHFYPKYIGMMKEKCATEIQKNLKGYLVYKKISKLLMNAKFDNLQGFFSEIRQQLLVDSQIKIAYAWRRYKKRKMKKLELKKKKEAEEALRKKKKKNNFNINSQTRGYEKSSTRKLNQVTNNLQSPTEKNQQPSTQATITKGIIQLNKIPNNSKTSSQKKVNTTNSQQKTLADQQQNGSQKALSPSTRKLHQNQQSPVQLMSLATSGQNPPTILQTINTNSQESLESNQSQPQLSNNDTQKSGLLATLSQLPSDKTLNKAMLYYQTPKSDLDEDHDNNSISQNHTVNLEEIQTPFLNPSQKDNFSSTNINYAQLQNHQPVANQQSFNQNDSQLMKNNPSQLQTKIQAGSPPKNAQQIKLNINNIAQLRQGSFIAKKSPIQGLVQQSSQIQNMQKRVTLPVQSQKQQAINRNQNNQSNLRNQNTNDNQGNKIQTQVSSLAANKQDENQNKTGSKSILKGSQNKGGKTMLINHHQSQADQDQKDQGLQQDSQMDQQNNYDSEQENDDDEMNEDQEDYEDQQQDEDQNQSGDEEEEQLQNHNQSELNKGNKQEI